MSKATFAAIAARAGVSTATVERVLNARGGVRPQTVQKVLAAAQALDLPRRLPDLHHGIFRIEVLMVQPDNTFYRRLSLAFERVAATLDKIVQIQRVFLDASRPEEIAERLLSGRVRGLFWRCRIMRRCGARRPRLSNGWRRADR